MMNNTWFVEHRIEWIKEILEIFGYISEDHIIRKFKISQSQARMDILRIVRLHPGLIEYNKPQKRYERVYNQNLNDIQ